MKYFIIRGSSDTKILGHYPQIKGIKHNCHVWDEPKFIEHHELVKIDFEPITSNAILYSNTNLTDLVSGGGMGFTRKLLVSAKLKKLLMNQNKTNLQFFESPLIQNNQYIYNYFVLNVTEASLNYIDFKNSEIYLMDGLFDDIKKLNNAAHAINLHYLIRRPSLERYMKMNVFYLKLILMALAIINIPKNFLSSLQIYFLGGIFQ